MSTVALLALLPVPALHAESRFDDVRWIVGRHRQALFRNEGFDDVEGVLTSDAGKKRLRFEAVRRSSFDVSFDRLTALHYEESTYPSRIFRRSGLYLTIHYTNTTGETTFETFRLSRDSAPALLAVLEQDTGLRIDRAPATTSFLGLPIHAGVGDLVSVISNTGHRTKGTIIGLSSSSIDLGPSGRFDAASARQIDVSDPIWDGAVNGAALLGIPLALVTWNRNYCDSCSIFPSVAAGLAVGAVVGALIDAKVMRRAYRGTERNGSSLMGWTPLLASNRKGMQVSLGF